jgi:hypothetical protein
MYRQARIELVAALVVVSLYGAFLCGLAIPYIIISTNLNHRSTRIVSRFDLLGDGLASNVLTLAILLCLLWASVKEVVLIRSQSKALKESLDAAMVHPLQLSFPQGTQKEEEHKVWGVSDQERCAGFLLAATRSMLTAISRAERIKGLSLGLLPLGKVGLAWKYQQRER